MIRVTAELRTVDGLHQASAYGGVGPGNPRTVVVTGEDAFEVTGEFVNAWNEADGTSWGPDEFEFVEVEEGAGS